jgi:hypothetical protein
MLTSPNTQIRKQEVEAISFNGDNLLFYILGIYFYHRNWPIRISSEPFVCIYFARSTCTCAAAVRMNIPQPSPSKSLAVNGESGSGG